MGDHEQLKQTESTLRPNPLGTAALVLGIICFVLAFIPFLDYGSGFIGLIGLVLGLVSLLGKNKRKKIAVAGTIVSAVALILSIVMAVTYTASFANSVKTSIDKTNADNATPVSVVYNVTGDSTDATVTYSTYANGQSGSEQATNQALPFSKTVTGTKGGFNSYTLTASNGSTGASITCTITVDGKVVSTQTASGQYASATCSSSH